MTKASDGTLEGRSPAAFVRWVVSNIAFGVPQSMSPIVFGIATLHLDRGLNTGAAMMTAMTTAQLVGAVPLATIGRRLSAGTYLRLLVSFRSAMFCILTVALISGASAPVAIGLAAMAGLPSGTIFGLMRATLTQLVGSGSLPRALGITATANELVFVAGPVAASLIASSSPPLALLTMITTSALPLITLPQLISNPASALNNSSRSRPGRLHARERIMTTPVVGWLACCLSSATAVSAVEVGAVALAVGDNLSPRWAIAFTVPLCICSVSGGVWVSVRNRIPGAYLTILMFMSTAIGTVMLATRPTLWAAIAGTTLIGFWLAPLSTLYFLKLENLLPAARRTEGFSLLRSAQGTGVVCSSVLLAVAGVTPTFAASATLCFTAAIALLTIHIRATRKSATISQTNHVG